MPQLDATKITLSNMSNVVKDWQVTPRTPDGISGQRETYYLNSNFAKQWGYFLAHPDLHSAILMKAIWDVGKGYTTDVITQVQLEHIMGKGKETFGDILFNMDVISLVGGDAYAEIIWEDKKTRSSILNLKVLDPSTIRSVWGDNGMLIRYEQVNKIPGISNPPKEFQPEDIFHLSNSMLADQIHGISVIDALEDTIKADMESFTDMKKIMHRQARPLIIFKLKTDNTTTRDAIIQEIDKAVNQGENVYLPDDENILSYEVVQVSVSEIINTWRNDVRNRFYRTIQLPQIVPGAGGQSTESESKVIYLAFEQIQEYRQRKIEDQIWAQLKIRLDLYPPTSIAQQLQQDSNKDGAMQAQPSDITAGSGR